MIYNGEQSIYNIKLQNAMLFNIEYKPLINTTLNEKFNIVPNYDISNLGYPTVNLLTIGTSSLATNGNNNNISLRRSKHSPIDAALFNHIPFLMVPLSEESNTVISNRYRLRKIINVDGIDYVAFYGYYVDEFESKPDIAKFSNIEHEYTALQKIDTSVAAVLNPVPLDNSDLTIGTTDYICDFIRILLFFTEKEVNGLANVIKILYPDRTDMYISEIGVCTSISDTITKDGKTYKESVASQIAYFLDVNIDIGNAVRDKYLEFNLELGGMNLMRLS